MSLEAGKARSERRGCGNHIGGESSRGMWVNVLVSSEARSVWVLVQGCGVVVYNILVWDGGGG